MRWQWQACSLGNMASVMLFHLNAEYNVGACRSAQGKTVYSFVSLNC